MCFLKPTCMDVNFKAVVSEVASLGRSVPFGDLIFRQIDAEPKGKLLVTPPPPQISKL